MVKTFALTNIEEDLRLANAALPKGLHLKGKRLLNRTRDRNENGFYNLAHSNFPSISLSLGFKKLNRE
jgi:hypothetical protein